MERFRWKIIYGGFMTFFVIWFFAANNIVVKLSKADMVSRYSGPMPEVDNNMLRYQIGRIEASNDLLEKVLIVGWAFGDVEQNLNEREVQIYLKNAHSCYCMQFSTPDNEESYLSYVLCPFVVKAFPQFDLEGRELGFVGTFSTVGVKDGLYEVFLYCRESEEYASLVDTGIWVEKKGASLSKVDWESKLNTPMVATSEEMVKYMIDSANESEGYLEVSGWALKEGENCKTQEVYLELTNMEGDQLFYTTDRFSRATVAETYGDSKYEMSGFKAKFPLDELPDDEWSFRVWIKNGENVWHSGLYYFQEAKQLTQNYMPTSDREVISCIDNITENETGIKLQGWVFAEGLDTKEQRVFISFKDADQQFQFTARSWERSDVATIYGNQYGQSGFVSILSFDDLPDGIWNMQLIVKRDDEIMFSQDYVVEKSGTTMDYAV